MESERREKACDGAWFSVLVTKWVAVLLRKADTSFFFPRKYNKYVNSQWPVAHVDASIFLGVVLTRKSLQTPGRFCMTSILL